VIHVSVSARTSSRRSAIASWIWAALLVADLLLRTAKFNQELGLDCVLRRRTAAVAERRRLTDIEAASVAGRYTNPDA